ncbi:MAG: hypothetical protein JEZ00_02510 [Anaerolineaceae bacterium]|nr:hypothetical protein [Anaerolineaceae bacterium]
MDIIRGWLKNPIILAAGTFVLGLFIGLVVLGWGLWPLQWEDASAQHLRDDLQQDYVRMIVDSYAKNNDRAKAMTRWEELGENKTALLQALQSDPTMNPEDVAMFANMVQSPMTSTELTFPALEGEDNTIESSLADTLPTVEPEKSTSGSVLLLVVSCLLMLAFAGAFAYVMLVRNKKSRANRNKEPDVADYNVSAMKEAQEISRQAEFTDYDEADMGTAIAQFMTTYMIGDDLYDDSFSIDSPSGEFLGECGVGISDTIGVGDPKKVTAFEVWLFDKNDIQTVTKVLMSRHAFNDPTISQRLASKGEPILLSPGESVWLETATLKLEARAVDMNYGQGALPDGSYFERMTLELAVWPK